MPIIVLKATPDRDLYCYWSEITECPIFIGNRTEMLAYLDEERRWARGPSDLPELRIVRADNTGTSDLSMVPGHGAWETLPGNEGEGFIYMQKGWLPRGRLAAVLDRMAAAPEDVDMNDVDISDLLDPLED